ncbi:MAG: ACT domain-containing protein [Desulfobacterales bacterium]|nr:ACT domain-containing protein [Desulfobacterales bacterium]
MYDTIIELKVRNHPGVMSQITGLFARKAFNLEGIVCRSEGDATQSRMVLLVYKNARMDQLIKQLAKLYDVLKVSVAQDMDGTRFKALFGNDQKDPCPMI